MPADRLLTAAGVAGVGPVFPQSVPCPFVGCGGRAGLYQDTATESVWHRCPACGRRGTPVDAAAVLWGVPTDVAVARLADAAGTAPVPPAAVAAYGRWVTERAALDRLVARAAGRFPRLNADLTPLHPDLTAATGNYPGRWAERGARFAVAAERGLIEPVSGPKLFPEKWADAWLVPLHDLPGRLAGAVAVAGGQVGVIPAWDNGPHPAGWSAVESLQGGGPVVLACDPVAAVRMSVRHLASVGGGRPFACVGCLPAAPACRWPLGPNRPVTVWAEGPTADAVRHARAVGGRLAFGPYDAGVAAVRRLGAAKWAADLRRRSRPWPAVAADVLSDLAAGDAARAATAWDLSAAEWEAVVTAAGRARRDAVTAARTAAKPPPVAVLDGKRVRERNGRWELDPSGEVLTNAPPRLRSVVIRGGVLWYTGTVAFDGEAFDFEARADKFQKNAFAWLLGFLLDRRATKLPYFHPKWGTRACAVAALLHPPSVVQGD